MALKATEYYCDTESLAERRGSYFFHDRHRRGRLRGDIRFEKKISVSISLHYNDTGSLLDTLNVTLFKRFF